MYLVLLLVYTVDYTNGDIIQEGTVELSIPQGDLIGRQYLVTEELYVNFFGRIPFATPPLGDLRFRAPVPPEGWDGQRDATYYGPGCTQLGQIFYNASLDNLPVDIPPDPPFRIPMPDPLKEAIRERIRNFTSDTPLKDIIGTIRNVSQTNLSLSDIIDEDCLYMNIYAPQRVTPIPDEKFPVMVFIQGGGFAVGTAMYLYDGRILAEKKNVIVVNFNYRLGSLGKHCHRILQYVLTDHEIFSLPQPLFSFLSPATLQVQFLQPAASRILYPNSIK